MPTGDKITISDPASVKNVSDTAAKNNTFEYELENAEQYESVETGYGKLSITPRSVTMTSATDSKEYDGSALTNDEVKETGDGFIEGEGATYDVTGSQTEVGESGKPDGSRRKRERVHVHTERRDAGRELCHRDSQRKADGNAEQQAGHDHISRRKLEV